MKYVVFNTDGEIVAYGEGTDLNDHGVGTAMEGDATPFTHYVLDGVLVPYTAAQAAAKADRPDCPATWSNTSFAWVDQRSLDQAKDDKWETIKALRDLAPTQGFTWDGSHFQSDLNSTAKIQGAAQMALIAMLAGKPFSEDWTLTDNTVRTLSGSQMIEVGVTLGTLVGTSFSKGRILRSAIYAATSINQLDAIQWA